MRERRVLSKQEFFNASETQNQTVENASKSFSDIIIYLTFLISTDCFIKKIIIKFVTR